MITIILSQVFGVVESFWRRWFGGYFEHHQIFPKWLNKIFESRGVQTVFNIALLTLLFMSNQYWVATPICKFILGLGLNKWILALIMACLFQFMYWSLGHGPAFDMNRGGKPSESTISRYHREKWSFIPDKIVPEEHWYGFIYDFIWMTARYTYGVLFIIPFVWTFKILWLGLIIASIYALCWTIQERDSWIFKYFPKESVETATNLAEFIAGYITAVFLMFL